MHPRSQWRVLSCPRYWEVFFDFDFGSFTNQRSHDFILCISMSGFDSWLAVLVLIRGPNRIVCGTWQCFVLEFFVHKTKVFHSSAVRIASICAFFVLTQLVHEARWLASLTPTRVQPPMRPGLVWYCRTVTPVLCRSSFGESTRGEASSNTRSTALMAA